MNNEFELFVSEVLLGADPHNILSVIKRRMQQYHLFPRYHIHEIFTEAYLRTLRRIETGEIIANLPASFKITILHIAREYGRKQSSQRNLERKLENTPDTFAEIPIHDSAIESNLLRLQEALKKMKPQELLILRLRIVEGFSWPEIGDYLVGCGEAEDTPQLRSTLRTKGKRALEKLRRHYFSA